MAKATTKIVIPHGVVFLYDPTMIIEVPADTSVGPVLHTDNCVSIWTIQEDEGKVRLSFLETDDQVTGLKVFVGFLETVGRRIAFNDSSVNPVLEREVHNVRTKISLFTNDALYPDEVTCVIMEDNRDLDRFG